MLKNMEKIKIETVKKILSYELDDFIRKLYGKPYCFQQQAGCMERGNHYIEIIDPALYKPHSGFPDSVEETINGNDMCVSFKSWLETNPEEHKKRNEWSDALTKLFWQRNFYPCLEDIMQDLCKRGHIEPGEYMIEIDW